MDNRELTYFDLEQLTIHFLEGTITKAELDVLKEHLESSPEDSCRFQEIRDTWLKTNIATGRERYNTGQAWAIVDRATKTRNFRVRSVWKYAAILITIVGAGVWFMNESGKDSEEHGAIAALTHNDNSSKVTLILENNKSIDLYSKTDTLLQTLSIQKQDNTLDYKAVQTAQEGMEYNRLLTGRGGEYSVILSDGTNTSTS